MAKESTHIWFAERLSKKIKNKDVKKIIKDHRDYYYMGSIFPDIFSLTKNPDMKTLSNYLHGATGTKTNKFVFDFLDKIKENKEKNLAFIFGFLTHYAFDTNLHPSVTYYSGFLPETLDTSRDWVYMHWHIETWLDQELNSTHTVKEHIHPELSKDIVAGEALGFTRKDVTDTFKNHKRLVGLEHSKLLYYVYYLKDKVFGPGHVHSAFHENLKYDLRRLPKKMEFPDPVTGKKIKTDLDKIISDSEKRGKRLMLAAYKYSTGKLTKRAAEKLIPGHNFDTGMVGVTADNIRYADKDDSLVMK